MTTQKPILEQQMSQMQIKLKSSGIISNYNESTLLRDEKDEEMSRSALAMFRAKEEEIEKKKMEVRDKVHAHLGRVEEATKRLAEIREVSLNIIIIYIYIYIYIFSCYCFFLFDCLSLHNSIKLFICNKNIINSHYYINCMLFIFAGFFLFFVWEIITVDF
jgi:hypothetical protein